LASYGVNLLIRLILLTFLSPLDFAKPPIDDKYFSYPIATSFALNAVIIVIMNSILNSYKNANTQRELQEIKLQHSEAQKQVLVQQMQPHFLFNALSNLKSLIAENTVSAQDYVVKLSEFLRYSVEAHHTEVVSLRKELDFTEDYIDLQKVRFENAFTYEVDIPNEVMQYQLPVLALQTLVENIFKHNYFTEKKPLHFTITYKPNEIIVWNRKSSVKLTERSSTGLANLNKRYELIFHKSISIKDADEAFVVIIPLLPT
jgi:LytS/YehU family sensor histidine kinase